jgi:hypothetical protein
VRDEAAKARARTGYNGALRPEPVALSDTDENREAFMAFALGHARGAIQAAGPRYEAPILPSA